MKSIGRLLVSFVAGAVTLLFAGSLEASGTHTWSGNSATTALWSDAANWDSVPTGDGSDALVFPGVAGRKILSNDFAAGTLFQSITFSGPEGGYSISGNGIKLSIGITDQTTFLTNTLSFPIAMFASFSISVTARTVALTGVVSGSSQLTKTGAGTLTFGAANMRSGGTFVLEGFVGMFNPEALGSGTVTVASGATLSMNGAGPIGNTLILNGTGQSNNGALNSSGTWSGPVTIHTNADVNPGATPIIFQTGVNGAGTLRVANNVAGDLVLLSTCTHAATEVRNGNLVLNGTHSGPITLVHGTLAGTGTVLNSVTTTDTGSGISPGSAGPGALHVGAVALATDAVALTTDATYTVQLNGPAAGTNYDQLVVTGGVSLGSAHLAVTLGFTPVVGQTFTIVSNDLADAIKGTFLNLPEGGTLNASGRHMKISYVGGTGNDVVLTARYLAGDVNGDGSVNVQDVFYLINDLFAAGSAPVGDGDVNGDAVVSVADVFALINYLFASGPQPA